jgi:hypothetical protein
MLSVTIRAVASLLALAGIAYAAETAIKKYTLPEKGSFQMKVPVDWTEQVRQPPQSSPPTITFAPTHGKPFEILVTPIWRVRTDVPASTKETIRQSVQRAADDTKSQAVEKSIPLVEFSSSTGPGYYFSATDRAPKPGEFKYLTQGILKVSDLTVTFTILTNEGQEQVTRDAIGMLQSAVHIQP